MSIIRTILGRAVNHGAPHDSYRYWQRRARQHGRNAVVHVGHDKQAFDELTERQWSIFAAALRPELDGREQQVVDLGCGPGRFTPRLAELTGASVMGVDPIRSLVALAPVTPQVSYCAPRNGRIPLADATVDIVFIALVLGGLTGSALDTAVEETQRVLKPGGLLLFAENTTPRHDAPHWHYRSEGWYQSLFESVDVKPVACYDELDETVTVFSGRRQP